MPDVSRSTEPAPMEGFDDAHPAPAEPGPDDVTPDRARMLANHAIYVQGGFSDPDIEADRARKQLAQSPGSIDWARMATEVADAMTAKLASLVGESDEARADRVAVEQAASPSDPDAVDVQLDLALIRRYKDLRAAQAISETEAAAIKKEADKIQDQLVEMFSDAGMQNVNIDGKTAYLSRTVYAQWTAGLDMEEKKAALIRAGAADLVTETVNASTLSAWVRELTEDDDAPGLPSELDGILAPGEKFAIRIIAGGTKSKAKTHSK